MGKKVLIIEDNLDMQENTAELLELAGYSVVTASNGKEGIEKAKSERPDLILCDIMMPELDGYGVLRVIESFPELASIPFIFLTAKSERTDFRKAMDLGADDYLVKPFEGDELLSVVESRIRKGEILNKEYPNTLEGLNDFLETSSKLLGSDVMKEPRTIKKLRKKDSFYLEGDTANHLYFIISGKVKTFRTNDLGKEYITNIFKEGDFFGYLSLFENFIRMESAIAIEDSEVAILPRAEFQKIIFSNNRIVLKFIKLISNDLNETEKRLLELAYNSARKRVADSLIFVYKKYDAKENTSLAITRENISCIAGIAPESVSRNLSDFKDEGLIEIDNGIIKIINLHKLEKLRA